MTKSLQDHKGRSNTPKRIKFLLNQFYEHLIEQGFAYDNPTLKCKVSNRYKKTYMDSKGQHKNNENYKAIPVAERARFIRALDDGLVEYLIGLAKKHGFRQEFGLHYHMLRQTFSNMQIENKRNIKDVQHLLGHKDAKTTQLHYNSVIDQELDYEGAKLLDGLFNDTTLYDGEEHIKKDVPAYHLDNNTFNEEKAKKK